MAVKVLAVVENITGDFALTSLQAAADIISLRGEPAVSFIVSVPEGVQVWLFHNQTRQIAFIQTAQGSAARVMPSRSQNVWVDLDGNASNVV